MSINQQRRLRLRGLVIVVAGFGPSFGGGLITTSKLVDNRGMRISCRVVVLICASINCRAQPRPEFEVASVKSSPDLGTPTININLGNFKHGTLTFGNVSLSDLLKYAYAITSDAQLAGPDWIKSKAVRFDIEAKTVPDTPVEQLRLMLQTLLAERMKVTLHHEQREMRYLALARGKNGLKMAKALEPPPPDSGYTTAGRIVRHHMPMTQLATLISRFERQPWWMRRGWRDFTTSSWSGLPRIFRRRRRRSRGRVHQYSAPCNRSSVSSSRRARVRWTCWWWTRRCAFPLRTEVSESGILNHLYLSKESASECGCTSLRSA